MMLLQQFTGINAIMFYAQSIFEQAHFQVGTFETTLNNSNKFPRLNLVKILFVIIMQ